MIEHGSEAENDGLRGDRATSAGIGCWPVVGVVLELSVWNVVFCVRKREDEDWTDFEDGTRWNRLRCEDASSCRVKSCR